MTFKYKIAKVPAMVRNYLKVDLKREQNRCGVDNEQETCLVAV
jgi:hypothetical protein